MSEIVGSLGMELELKRDRFDREVQSLRNLKDGQIRFAASLDTRALRRQVENLSKLNPKISATVAVSNLNAVEGQLRTLTRDRQINVGIRLDDRAVSQQLQALTQSRVIRLQAALINSTAIENQIASLTRDRRIKIGFEFDDKGVFQKLSKYSDKTFKVTAQVDDSRLTALNKHLDLKQKHFDQVNNYFKSSPLTPRTDLTYLDALEKRLDAFKNSSIDIGINFTNIQDQIASLKAQLSKFAVPVTVRYANTQAKPITQEIKSDTKDFEKNITNSVERAFKQAKTGNLFGGVGSIASIPFKVAGSALSGAAGSIASGLTLGITQPITEKLGKGVSNAIELAISNSVGSSELFAQKSAQLLGGALQKGLTQGLDNLPELLSAQIAKLGDELNLPSGVTKKIGRQLKRGLEEQIKELRSLGKDVSQAATAIVGEEGAEEGLAVRGKARQKNRARRGTALKQSIEEQRNAVDAQGILDRNLSTLSRQSAQERGKYEQLYRQLQQRVNQLRDQVAAAQAKGDTQQLATLLPELQLTTGKLSSVGGDLELLRTFNPKRVERARTRRDRIQSELEAKQAEQAQAQAAYAANPNDKNAIDRFGELSAEITELESKLKSLNKSLEIVDTPKQRAQEKVDRSIVRTQGLQATANREQAKAKEIELLQQKEAKLVKAAANFAIALEKASQELAAAQQSGDVDAAVTAFKRKKVAEANLAEVNKDLAPVQEQMRLKAVSSISEKVAPKPVAPAQSAPPVKAESPKPTQPVQPPVAPKAPVQQSVASQPTQPVVSKQPVASTDAIPDPWMDSAPIQKVEPIQPKSKQRKGLDVTVDMDRLGEVAYQTGAAIKTVGETGKKVASVFRVMANSEAGQAFIGGVGNATRSFVAIAKTGYKVASAMEALALDMVPMGRTTKGILQQTAVPALAFGAATHFLPGGQVAAEGLNQLVGGAIAPFAQSATGAATGAATNFVQSAIPNFMGMQGMVGNAVTGMIQSGSATVTEMIVQAGTVILGGKVLTGVAGNAMKSALPPSQQNALPPSQTRALPQATIDTQPVTTIAALPPAPTPKVTPQAEIVQNPFEGLTRPQMLAASRKLGIQGVNSKTTKGDLEARLKSYRDQGEVDRVLEQVRSEIGKDGKPIAGVDKKAEAAAIKKLATAEKSINKKISVLATATGKKRETLINEILSGTQSAIAEIDQLKGQNLSGETIRSLSGIQGRLENSYRNNPTLNDARNERIQTARSAAIQSANQRNITGLARVTAPAEAETATLGRTLKEGVRKLTNFTAKQFDVIPQPTIKGTLGAIAKSPKAKDLATDLAVNTAGFAASKLGEQYGIVPGLAGDLMGALAMRQVIARGRPSGKDLTGDLAGFAIGNGFATAANAGLDALSGVVPGAGLLKSIPLKGAIAAMATVPKVQQATEKFQQPEGLARVGSGTDGLLGRFKSLFSGNQQKANRLSSNYEAIYREIAALSGVAFDPKNLPKLSIDPKRLKAMGAEAFYDIEKNTIVIDQTLARILSGRASELKRSTERLKGLIHEGRHSVQLDQGRLTLEQAATGQNVPLYDGRYLSEKQRSQVAASVEVARKSGASASQLNASKALETDAYAFEANTQNILARVSRDSNGGMFAGIRGMLDRVRKAFSKSSGAQQLDRSIAQAEAARANVEAQLTNFDQLGKALEAKSNELQRRNDQDEAFKQLDSEAELQSMKKSRRSFTPEERKRFAGLQREVDRANPVDGLAGLSQGVTDATARISEATKSSNLLGGALGNLGGFAKTAIAGFVGFTVLSNVIPAIQNFTSESLKAAIALERVKTSLNFSTGNSGKALGFISKEADRLGLSLQAAQDGYAQLSGATRGTSVQGAATDQLFSGVGAASTTLGLTGEQQSRIFNALSQTASKGKLSAEELRGQIGDAGLVGSFGTAARSLGISEAELNKRLELGQVTAEEFLPKFGRQLQIEYGGSAKSAAGGTQANLNRFGSSVTALQQAQGAMFTPAVSKGASILAGALELITNNIETLTKVAISFGVTFGATLLAPFAQAIASTALLQKGLGLAAAGLGAVKTALLPLAAKFLAITAAIEVGKNIFDRFLPSDLGNQFKTLADQAEENLERIRTSAKNARGEVSQVAQPPKQKSNGIVDDALIGLNKLSDKTGLSKVDKFIYDRTRNIPVLDKIGEFVFTPFETSAQAQERNDQAEINRASKRGREILGEIGSSKNGLPFFEQQLGKAQGIDRQVTLAQNERNRLAAQPKPDRDKIKEVDQRIKALNEERTKVTAPVVDAQSAIQGLINGAQQNLNNPQLKPEQRKQIEADLKKYQEAATAINQLQNKFDTAADRVADFRKSLAELNIDLENIKRNASIEFNIKSAKAINQQIAGAATDENASLNNAVTSAQLQSEQSQKVYEESKARIEQINPKLATQEAQDTLAGIVDTKTGKSLSADSSFAEIEKAKQDTQNLTTKSILDELLAYKAGLEQISEAERQAATDRKALQQSEFDRKMALLDKEVQRRELANRKITNVEQIGLINKQKNKSISEEDAAIESAKISGKQAGLELDSAQKQLQDLNAAKAAGQISEEQFQQKKLELEGKVSDLTLRKAQEELNLREAINRKILEGFERRNRIANARIDIGASDQIRNIKASQLNGTIIGEGGQTEANKVELSATQQRIALKQSELSEVRKLRQQRVISEKEAADRELAIEQELSNQRSRLVDLQTQQVLNQIQAQVDAQKRASDAKITALESEKVAIENANALLDNRKQRLETELRLQQAISSSRQSSLNIGVDRAAEAGDLQRQLREGSLGKNSAAVARNQLAELGFSGGNELQTLAAKQALQAEMDAEKLAALQEQQRLERESLQLDIQKQKNLAILNRLERDNAVLKAESNIITAKGELDKALKTGDVNAIENARSQLDINNKLLENARKQQAAQAQIGSTLDGQLRTQLQISDITQQQARNELESQSLVM